jgi:dipeptidyl aminopeptidase/acylaminoacyl peptidase
MNYIFKEKEGHVFRNNENRLEFYKELEKFLEQNLSRE